MGATDMSTGRMVAYAFDRSTGGSEPAGPNRPTRREAFARRMLEYVLMHPKARRVLLSRIVDIDATAAEPRPRMRTSGAGFDLVLPLDPAGTASSGDDGTGARPLLGIVTKIDGDMDAAAIRERLTGLGGSPDSRLLVIAPRSKRFALDGIASEDPRIVTTTWARLARRTAMKDAKREALWQLLGEFGEDAGPLAVHTPASPALLLDESVVAELRAHLDTLRLASETLLGRPARFSTARDRRGARLGVGGTGGTVGLDFGTVEAGTPVWLAGGRPATGRSLGLGALDEETRPVALERLAALSAEGTWTSDLAALPEDPEFIGEPASSELEPVRSLLWEVFDPRRLSEAGFPMVPRQQPDLDERRLAVRVGYPADEAAGTFLIAIGDSSTWRTLLPRVIREYDGRTYIVQVKKSTTAEDLVTDVHKALRSLATKP